MIDDSLWRSPAADDRPSDARSATRLPGGRPPRAPPPGIEVAMLAVPGDAADEVAGRLAGVGIRGILNFAPVRLQVPEGVSVVSVDLTVALEQLAYKLSLGLDGAEHHDEHHD